MKKRYIISTILALAIPSSLFLDRPAHGQPPAAVTNAAKPSAQPEIPAVSPAPQKVNQEAPTVGKENNGNKKLDLGDARNLLDQPTRFTTDEVSQNSNPAEGNEGEATVEPTEDLSSALEKVTQTLEEVETSSNALDTATDDNRKTLEDNYIEALLKYYEALSNAAIAAIQANDTELENTLNEALSNMDQAFEQQ